MTKEWTREALRNEGAEFGLFNGIGIGIAWPLIKRWKAMFIDFGGDVSIGADLLLEGSFYGIFIFNWILEWVGFL